MQSRNEGLIQRARAAVAAVQDIVVSTGAGVSAGSGVPTFRSSGKEDEGFWGKYSPEQLATPEGFAADPKLAYDWYTWRRRPLAEVRPNAAHLAIGELQRQGGAVVITQNIDGLHERVMPAGATVLRVHGSLAADRCSGCSRREEIDVAAPPALRRCSRCNSYLRPDVVWFGEPLDPRIWEEAEEAARHCDLMLVVGTSGIVWPAAGLVHIAARKKAQIIAVNLEASELDEVATFTLLGRAAEIVPQIVT